MLYIIGHFAARRSRHIMINMCDTTTSTSTKLGLEGHHFYSHTKVEMHIPPKN